MGSKCGLISSLKAVMFEEDLKVVEPVVFSSDSMDTGYTQSIIWVTSVVFPLRFVP